MSGIMSPGHPSATCRREMRDLVSTQSRWGFPDWGRERKREEEGFDRRPEEGGGSVHPRIPLPSSSHLRTLSSIPPLHVLNAPWLSGCCFDS